MVFLPVNGKFTNKLIRVIHPLKVILCSLFLSGCASDSFHYREAESKSVSYKANDAQVSVVPKSGYYRVSKGDTLFSIAFRYGVDYRSLATINHIDAPYLIYPNQKIRLVASQRAIVSTAPVQKAKVKDSQTKPKIQQNESSTPNTVPVKKPVSIVNHPIKVLPKVVNTPQNAPNWRWPVAGSVIRSFSNSGVSSKGIDIKGTVGKPVIAAADGSVVYAGNGLIGYGNLVIVKHNDEYLSAYAYNQSILVKEQQLVKAGDSLAIIGGKGNERPLLHFEIRRDGQPIDPLKVLPKQ